MSNPLVIVGKHLKTLAVSACIGVFLAQTAAADSLNHTSYDFPHTNHNSVITITARQSGYTLSVSTWHMNRRHRQHENLAPKAKIMDVQDASAACAYEHGVCILRGLPTDAL